MNDDLQNIGVENVIGIESLTDYMKEITDLRKRLLSEGRSESLFFRGQKNIEWDIRPSIFRESLISVEDKIIQMALSRAPFEFNNCIKSFGVLTKLQHYGLPTRLLDVTMNPLIALYFACIPTEQLNKAKNKDTNGVVFYCSAYGEHEWANKVNILSSIAKINFDGDISLNDLLNELGLKGTTKPDYFIQILQSNIFVNSSYSNSRIICQNGAFMLSGAISITKNVDNIWDSKVQKSVCSLNNVFNKEHFVISSEAKEDIIDELNFININEGTLFPELEHQMSHIRRIGKKEIIKLVPEFIQYESSTDTELNNTYSDEFILEKENIKIVVNKYIKDKKQANSIINEIIKSSKYPDWYKRDIIKNSLISTIKRILVEVGIINARETSINIINEVAIIANNHVIH